MAAKYLVCQNQKTCSRKHNRDDRVNIYDPDRTNLFLLNQKLLHAILLRIMPHYWFLLCRLFFSTRIGQ